MYTHVHVYTYIYIYHQPKVEEDPLTMSCSEMTEKQKAAALTMLVASKFNMDGYCEDKTLIAFVVGEILKDKQLVSKTIDDQEVSFWPSKWPAGRNPTRRGAPPPPPGAGPRPPRPPPPVAVTPATPAPPPYSGYYPYPPMPPGYYPPPNQPPPPSAAASSSGAASLEDRQHDEAMARLDRSRSLGHISEAQYSSGKAKLMEKYLGFSLDV